jgi:hypothetical protein
MGSLACTIRRTSVMAFVLSGLACGGPEPRAPAPPSEGVPANSSSEARLRGDEGNRPAPPPSKDDDPTQPLMTPLAPASAGTATSSGAPGPGSGATTKTGPVSRDECEAVVDHGLDLLIASSPQFAGIPPEMIAEFKTQAKKDKSADSPCDKGISRTEYSCGMAATTSADFQKCSKKKK